MRATLHIAPEGMTIEGFVNAGVLAALDAARTTQYAASLSLGKIIGQDGAFMDAGSFARPVFTLDQKISAGLALAVVGDKYHVTTNDGGKFIFDENGKLESFTSATGEEITALYDLNDRLYRYENEVGDFLEFTYDGSGRIESVEDADGHVSTFTYSIDGALIAVEDDGGETAFTYDSDGNLLTAERDGGPELAFNQMGSGAAL